MQIFDMFKITSCVLEISVWTKSSVANDLNSRKDSIPINWEDIIDREKNFRNTFSELQLPPYRQSNKFKREKAVWIRE
jgi:hypothetical protein